MKSSSLTRQRVPSAGMSLMPLLASVQLFSSLELTDEESVRAEAVAMKRRQMELTYDASLTCFGPKDFLSVLSKTAVLQLSTIAHCVSSMVVFPAVLAYLPVPAWLSQYCSNIFWPAAPMALFLIADLIGRHISALALKIFGCFCSSGVGICGSVAAVTLQLLAVMVRIWYMCTTLLLPIFFATDDNLTIEASLTSCVESLVILGLTHGLLGTTGLLLASTIVEPHEKGLAGTISGICMSLGCVVGVLLAAWFLTDSVLDS